MNIRNQNELQAINQKLGKKAEELFEKLCLSLERYGDRYGAHCQIHGGNNSTAFSIYPYKEIPYWRCFTFGCHKKYGATLIGLVRGVLSKNTVHIPFAEVILWCEDFLGGQVVKVESSEKQQFIQQIETKSGKIHKISRAFFRERVKPPAEYFIKRGYSEAVIDKYDVGICFTKGKEMCGRAVAPCHDDDLDYIVGCTGRSLNNEFKPKWKHSSFSKGSYLYNLAIAKKVIAETGTILIVEGPGDIWKLEMAGIHNAVALLGSNLTLDQQHLLEQTGALYIKVLTDNDEAGRKCKLNIYQRLYRLYDVDFPSFAAHDIGDLSISEIQQLKL